MHEDTSAYCVQKEIRERTLTMGRRRYFGRARELPGVKELFQTAGESSLLRRQSQVLIPAFSQLLRMPSLSPTRLRSTTCSTTSVLATTAIWTRQMATSSSMSRKPKQKVCSLPAFPPSACLRALTTAWEDALDHLRETHGLDIPQPPPLPTPSYISLDPSAPVPAPEEPAATGSKRKASAASTAAAKKAKLASGAAERTGNGFMSVLKAEDLRPPTLLSMEEMEAYIVAQQKAALLAEYGA